MKPTQLLPIWAFLALVLTACAPSRYQCAPNNAQVVVHNWTFGDLLVVSSLPSTNYLRYDKKAVLTQSAVSGTIPELRISVRWRKGNQSFVYPAEPSSGYFLGPVKYLDLVESDDSTKIIHCCQ